MIMLMTFPLFLLKTEEKLSGHSYSIRLNLDFFHAYIFVKIFNVQEALHVLNYRDGKTFWLDLKIRFNMYSFKFVLLNK